MDVSRYTEFKEGESVKWDKAITHEGKVIPVLIKERWDDQTGKKVEPERIAVSIEEYEKQMVNLQKAIGNLKVLVEDAKELVEKV